MNYLAHALLAEPYAHSLIGNIAGDLVKGPLSQHRLHPRVADGVRRHRRVDVLTDRHDAYRSLRSLFPEGERRYSGLVLDVLFDHYLVRHWQRFTDWQRDAFLEGTYRVLRENPQLLPSGLALVAKRWTDADWLRVYETREGVVAVLERLAQRLKRPVALASMLDIADEHAGEFDRGFLHVFTDVQRGINA
ncbi:ACP phosphodiesterase [Congregibacter brevis]|uniref:ACP phosphodiesterase n=1 Tax=Congregibacter brevis TaxID=3081201 RepID=A0ABZ0IBU8_9GAMM|nr:ACP phosphodiesterase [Congregibacter sp. IMCC45268]